MLNLLHVTGNTAKIAKTRLSLALPSFSRGQKHSLPQPLIVSLTSFPPRFAGLVATLRSLLRQTIKADRTVLWIATHDKALVPPSVLRLRDEGLEIRYTEDTRSYKKILPTLRSFPEAFICTADDDVYYWPTWLEELVNALDDDRLSVPCHRAHEIALDRSGNLRPYREWRMQVGQDATPGRIFPTGCGGVLYPPGILAHDNSDIEAALEFCPTSDDLWLFWIAKRNGARFKNLANNDKILFRRAAHIENLWTANNFGEGNDLPIRRMIDRYGLPNCSA